MKFKIQASGMKVNFVRMYTINMIKLPHSQNWYYR